VISSSLASDLSELTALLFKEALPLRPNGGVSRINESFAAALGIGKEYEPK
jgi:hypothetical protein